MPLLSLPRISLGARIFGASHAPKLITLDPSVVSEVAAVPALTVAPAVVNEKFLLQQGERVVEWLASTFNADALRQAWAEVSCMLAARAAEVWEMLCRHPYAATVGMAVVAGAFLVCLLRRKAQDFLSCTEAAVDRLVNNSEWPGTVPQHFFCPITLEVMRDPCITPSGHSYERLALERWIAVEGTEPQTRLPLTPDQVFPNRGLKDAILAWRKELLTAADKAEPGPPTH